MPLTMAYKREQSISFFNQPLLNHHHHHHHHHHQEEDQKMEFPAGFHPSSLHSFFNYHLLSPHHFLPQNHVHWRETPESHIYSADLPGVEKEKIRVEVEDSRYLIIRTEGENDDESTPATRSFMRKFRLPGMVDVDGISAGYRDGVLTVTVPRSFVRRRGVLLINPTDRLSFGASAA